MLTNTLKAGFTLARRSILLQMKEHALGYTWALLVPMLYAGCYIFIKRQLSDSDLSGASHNWDVLRAFTGITFIQLWMHLVQETSGFIRRNKGFLRGMNVGSAPFVIAIALEGALSCLIRGVLVTAAIPILGLTLPHAVLDWAWVLIAAVSLLLSATAIGLLLAPWAAIYADIRKALASISLPIILLSPVFYPAIEVAGSPLFWLNTLNPVGAPLAVLNAAYQGQGTIYASYMLGAGLISIMLSFLTLRKLELQLPIVLERIGN